MGPLSGLLGFSRGILRTLRFTPKVNSRDFRVPGLNRAHGFNLRLKGLGTPHQPTACKSGLGFRGGVGVNVGTSNRRLDWDY